MRLHVWQAIKEELSWLAFILFVGLLLGFLLEKTGFGLIVALACYILFHFRQSWKVLTWLSNGSPSNIPSTYGLSGAFVQQALKSEKINRKRKKRLSALLKRFNEVLTAMPDAIVILDEFGGIEWFNESARHLLRMRTSQDIGRHITLSIQEKDFGYYYNKKDYDHSINIHSPFNTDLHLNIRIAAYGKKKQLLSARDITRMRQLEGVRSLFVANVSHELRTPLTVISGYLELLSDENSNTQSDEITALQPIFQQMGQQADRMTTLLDDLLMLANLENEQITEALNETVCIGHMVKDIYKEAQILKREEKYTIICDINEALAIKGNAKELHSAFTNLVTNALLMLANLENEQITEALNETVCIGHMVKDIYKEAQILKREEKYTIICDINEALAIKGNAKELHSAFTNLVTNALRYTPAGGEIKISWKQDGQTARFMVQDNGIGIELKHIDRLTERFYRVDKGRSRSTGGTGLGLAIVKHVLFKHDANLEIESEFEKGSAFTCVFPHERVGYCD